MQVYIFFLFCLILKHSQAWYFVDMPPLAEFLFYCMLLGAGVVANKGNHAHLKKHQFILLFIVLACSLLSCRGIFGLSIFAIVNVLIVAQLFQLDERKKHKAFITLNKWIWVLTVLSISIGMLVKIGVPLPSFGTLSWRQYVANNYLFYFEVVRSGARFTGFTLEPGYMGLLMAVMLVVNRFEINKYTITYLIGLAWTMSMGGWIITLIAYVAQYCFSNIQKNRKRVMGLIAFTVLLLSAVFFVTNVWNGGDNTVNEMVFSRLEYDEDKGFAGNNRAAGLDQQLAFLSFLNSDDVYMGLGNIGYSKLTTEEEDWAGYTTFLMRYGIIPTILVFLASVYYVRRLNNLKFLLPAVLVWFLDWWQHSGLFPPVLVIMFLYFELFSKAPRFRKRIKTNRVNTNSNEIVKESPDLCSNSVL